MAAGCAVAIGTGHFRVAFLMLVLTGPPRRARRRRRQGGRDLRPRTVGVPRFGFGSAERRPALHPAPAGLSPAPATPMALLPFALYIAASLVSYQRARPSRWASTRMVGSWNAPSVSSSSGIGLLFGEQLLVPVLVLMLLLHGGRPPSSGSGRSGCRRASTGWSRSGRARRVDGGRPATAPGWVPVRTPTARSRRSR